MFGTNSEANSMAGDERMTVLDALVGAGVDPRRMMPGTGCCSIHETVELTAHAVSHGCAGVLMLPPFYYKDVSEEGLYRYFSEVVERVGDVRLRIYLYHIPPVAVVGITPRLVERLLKAYPSAIAGMKDSSSDWNNTKIFLDAFAVRDFDVFVGSESFLLANMRNGGVGTISATANVNPAAIYELYADARDEARSCAQTKRPTPNAQRPTLNEESSPPAREVSARLQTVQEKLNLVREVFVRKSWPSTIAALKQAIAIYGNDPEWARVRPPLIELTAEQARKLVAELEKIEFSIKLAEG